MELLALMGVFVAYLPDWRFDTFELDRLAGVTDVAVFSAEVGPEGSLDTQRIPDQFLAELDQHPLRDSWRVLLCVGGWERSANFSEMSQDPSLRAKFVGEITAYLDEHGLDGVDYDWEHPSGLAENDAYAALIAETKAAIGEDRIVTAAVAGWQDLSPGFFESIDRIHLMAYDHADRHSTFEKGVADVFSLVSKGARPETIALGMPFYGRGIEEFGRYEAYSDILDRGGFGTGVDEFDGLFFNGPMTLERKTRWAVETGLAGVMVWEITQDAADRRLTEAILRNLNPQPTPDGSADSDEG